MLFSTGFDTNKTPWSVPLTSRQQFIMMRIFTTVVGLLAVTPRVFAAFGVTTSTSSYVIDSGNANGFVVTVSRTDCSITSIKYRSAEYQYSKQSSHIASGLGSATVSYSIISSRYHLHIRK